MNFVEQIFVAIAGAAVVSLISNFVVMMIQNAVNKQRWLDHDMRDRAHHQENKETLQGQNEMLREISGDVKRINGTVMAHSERLEAQRREIDRLMGGK